MGPPNSAHFRILRSWQSLQQKIIQQKILYILQYDTQWQNDKSPSDIKRMLDFSFNENVVYNIGITVCYPFTVATTKISKLAAINKAKDIRL